MRWCDTHYVSLSVADSSQRHDIQLHTFSVGEKQRRTNINFVLVYLRQLIEKINKFTNAMHHHDCLLQPRNLKICSTDSSSTEKGADDPLQNRLFLY